MQASVCRVDRRTSGVRRARTRPRAIAMPRESGAIPRGLWHRYHVAGTGQPDRPPHPSLGSHDADISSDEVGHLSGPRRHPGDLPLSTDRVGLSGNQDAQRRN